VLTTVVKSFRFEAAHRLPWHPGRCSRPHGHSYRIEIAVRGPVGANGIVIDFDDVSAAARLAVLDAYDHQDLNHILENPTAENIAADALRRLRQHGLPASWVRLWETDTGSALVEWDGEHGTAA
jgi:6-pyruvoyltetrahydropterin/6-carboxytetrahydropterin synthase